MIGFSRYLRITSMICLILAIDPISAEQEIKCLSKDPDVISCVEHPCEAGYCIDIESRLNCCTETHCPETGLFSFPKILSQSKNLHWKEQYDEKTWYRKRQKIGGVVDTLTCLIPKSFELDTVATKFDKMKTPTCKTSSDCQDNEFCGTVINPSFCSQTKVCLDKSAEDGSSLTFCFKLPEVENRMFVSLRKDVGLPVCQSDEDCKKELPDEVSSCQKTDGKIRNIVGQTVKIYKNVCAKKFEQHDEIVGEKQSCWMTALLASGISALAYLLLTPIPFYVAYRYLKNRHEAEVAKEEAENETKIAAQNADLQCQREVKNKHSKFIENQENEIAMNEENIEKIILELKPERL